MSFDNAENTLATQEFSLTKDNFGKHVNCKQVKFQDINSLTV